MASLGADEIAATITEFSGDQLLRYQPRVPVRVGHLQGIRRITASRIAETIWGKSLPESHYRDLLHKRLGGRIEVRIPSGRIDVLTEEYCIEVKHFTGWKSAIGQTLSYCCYVPQKPAIALIDLPRSFTVPASVCHKLGVTLLDLFEFV